MEFTFKLTDKEAQTIMNSLAKEPYHLVFELINKFQTQASEQMKPEET